MIVATVNCKISKSIEELEVHICKALAHTLHTDGSCVLLPALPLPLESYILAAIVARNTHSKDIKIARKLSLEILARLLAHRQLSDIISVTREFAKHDTFIVILFSVIDKENAAHLHEKLREALSKISCSLTAHYIEDKDRVRQLIRSLHNVPQEYATPQLALSFSGCSTVLVH